MRKKKTEDPTRAEADQPKKRSRTRLSKSDDGHAPEKKTKKKKVKYEGGISGDLIYFTLMAVALAGVLLFIVSVFFKVSVIEVTGTSRTSATEIRNASGIEVGDRLLFVNRFSVSDAVFETNPYVAEIRVKKYPPNKVILEVTESEPTATVSSGSVYYLIDAECKLLEYYPITGPSAYPTIEGLEVQTRDLGKTLDLGDELRIVSLKTVVKAFAEDEEMASETGVINMEKLYDVTFTYDNRFRVSLGEADNLKKKFSLFKEVIKKLEKTDSGTINLKGTDSVTFMPE